MESKYLFRILIILVIVVIAGGILKILFTPKDFGNHGSLFYKFYRLSAIDDELKRPIKHFTNYSCLKCHPNEYKMQIISVHKSVSCEFCHGVAANHVDSKGKYIGKAIVVKKNALINQCLRCHNGKILARQMRKVVKTILYPDHLKNMKVKLSHTCDQCHVVHAPMKNIKQIKKFFALEGF